MATISPTRIQDSAPLTIVGTKRRYAPGQESEIVEQWIEFIPQMVSIPNRVEGVTYGVALTWDPVAGFDYLAGVEVSNSGGAPDGMDAVTLNSRHYAVFTHHGHYSLLPETFDAIWNGWRFTVSNVDVGAPSFERYGEEFNPETGIGGIEVWVPLISRS